jgi:hypothetical protein
MAIWDNIKKKIDKVGNAAAEKAEELGKVAATKTEELTKVGKEKKPKKIIEDARQAIINALIENSPQTIFRAIKELFNVELNAPEFESFVEVFKQLDSEGVIVTVGEKPKFEESLFLWEVEHPDYYKRQAERLRNLKDDIVKLLKDKGVKMPASDIDAHLKHQNVDEIKELCEGMYHNGEINRTGNYRYFILTEEKKKPKKAATKKPDPTAELRKYAKLKDDGLITEEDYEAKKKDLLGL